MGAAIYPGGLLSGPHRRVDRPAAGGAEPPLAALRRIIELARGRDIVARSRVAGTAEVVLRTARAERLGAAHDPPTPLARPCRGRGAYATEETGRVTLNGAADAASPELMRLRREFLPVKGGWSQSQSAPGRVLCA